MAERALNLWHPWRCLRYGVSSLRDGVLVECSWAHAWTKQREWPCRRSQRVRRTAVSAFAARITNCRVGVHNTTRFPSKGADPRTGTSKKDKRNVLLCSPGARRLGLGPALRSCSALAVASGFAPGFGSGPGLLCFLCPGCFVGDDPTTVSFLWATTKRLFSPTNLGQVHLTIARTSRGLQRCPPHCCLVPLTTCFIDVLPPHEHLGLRQGCILQFSTENENTIYLRHDMYHMAKDSYSALGNVACTSAFSSM